MSMPKPYRQIIREEHFPVPYQPSTPALRQHLAAFRILKQDFHKLIEYIEPDTENLNTYSHRTFELLLRTCTETESLMKLVFAVNNVQLGGLCNILRYSDLNGAQKLSEYSINVNLFDYNEFRPFSSFSDSTRTLRSPTWYKAYNKSKHNRIEHFRDASLRNLIEALGGLYVLLTAQVGLGFDEEYAAFKPSPGPLGGTLYNIQTWGGLFEVKSAPTWPDSEKYLGDWETDELDTVQYDDCPIPIIP